MFAGSMCLQCCVCRESLPFHIFRPFWRAYHTVKSCASVHPSLVCFQHPRTLIACPTAHSFFIKKLTDVRLLPFVYDRHMFLESSMFPKALPTTCYLASKFILTLMNSIMLSQSRSCNKAFSAAFARTDIFTNIRVRRLDMMF